MSLMLLSVNCGIPCIIGERNGQAVLSAFGKSPVAAETVFFGSLGIDGDAQANRSVHGGPDQAVCVYSADHWAWWTAEKSFQCHAATFGENLTVVGGDENTVGIGDRFLWDDVVLEVTQPRGPCANVDLYHRRDDLALAMALSMRCGWYMRVIHEGPARTRATVRHTVAGERPTIRDAFLARRDPNAPIAFRQRVHDTPALGAAWKRALARTLS